MSEHDHTSKVTPPSFLFYLISLLLLWVFAGWIMSKTCCESNRDEALATVPDVSQDDHLNAEHDEIQKTDALTDDGATTKLEEVDLTEKADDSSLAEAVPFQVALLHDDLNKPDFKPSESFRFQPNSYKLFEPMSKALVANLNTLKAALKTDPKNTLTLTGRYRSSEKNVSAFPNLGLARANHVKSLLVQRGFDAKQIELADSLDDDAAKDDQGIYDNRVSIGMGRRTDADMVNQQNTMSELGSEIRKKPLVLYFDDGKFQIRLTDAQRMTMLDMVRYLDQNPDAKVNVIGHTDGRGSAKNNKALSRKRVNTIAAYLQLNGLPNERIIRTAKGESEPVASNATPEGQAKNRRTVVTLY